MAPLNELKINSTHSIHVRPKSRQKLIAFIHNNVLGILYVFLSERCTLKNRTSLSLSLSLALLPFGPWPVFLFLNPIHNLYDSLNGGSARRKTATYTQNKHTDIHVSSWNRTHDPSVRAGDDGSCLRPRGHCDRRRIVTHILNSAPVSSLFRGLYIYIYIYTEHVTSSVLSL
jgi:hypothetical protein